MNESRRDTSACASSNETAESVEGTCTHAGGAADRAAQPKSWPRVAKKEPMVVIARDEEGGDPSSRRSRREAADNKGNEADQGGVRGGAVCGRGHPLAVDAAVKALSILCGEGQHHQDDEQAPRMVDAMVNDPQVPATSDALVNYNTRTSCDGRHHLAITKMKIERKVLLRHQREAFEPNNRSRRPLQRQGRASILSLYGLTSTRALGQGQVPLCSCTFILQNCVKLCSNESRPRRAARLQPVCALGSSPYIRPKRCSTERTRSSYY